MIESIGLALVKTLATFLFKTYLMSAPHVAIDGAPSWYLKNVSSQVCVYDHQIGGLEAVDRAKANAYPKMAQELAFIIESVIYTDFANVKDEKEKQFIYAFKNDAEAPVFVRTNLKFLNIDYYKKNHTAFVQACISKDSVFEYQKGRIDKIKYELSHHRADNAFDELDKSTPDFK